MMRICFNQDMHHWHVPLRMEIYYSHIIFQKEITIPHHWSESNHQIYKYSETLVILNTGGRN